MKHHYLFLAFLVPITACAMFPEQRRPVPATTKATNQQDLADEALDQRGQAYRLPEMAERRAVEAEVQAHERGSQDETVQEKRKLAEDLDAAADEAEQKARDLRQQVPHGMVQ